MTNFFEYKIKGSQVTPLLHFEVGYFNTAGLWVVCVVSGSLYEDFWHADQAAKKQVLKVQLAYLKRFKTKEAKYYG